MRNCRASYDRAAGSSAGRRATARRIALPGRRRRSGNRSSRCGIRIPGTTTSRTSKAPSARSPPCTACSRPAERGIVAHLDVGLPGVGLRATEASAGSGRPRRRPAPGPASACPCSSRHSRGKGRGGPQRGAHDDGRGGPAQRARSLDGRQRRRCGDRGGHAVEVHQEAAIADGQLVARTEHDGLPVRDVERAAGAGDAHGRAAVGPEEDQLVVRRDPQLARRGIFAAPPHLARGIDAQPRLASGQGDAAQVAPGGVGGVGILETDGDRLRHGGPPSRSPATLRHFGCHVQRIGSVVGCRLRTEN